MGKPSQDMHKSHVAAAEQREAAFEDVVFANPVNAVFL
jgi:hypothetical protein